MKGIQTNKKESFRLKSMNEIRIHKEIPSLIFKELIKRGYSLEGKTRIWDISDSKLWYLTPEQSQAYLDLIYTEDYKKKSTDRENKLIEESLKRIIEAVGDTPVNIIDLGCGDGLKVIPILKELRKNTKVRYCPVDISAYMVNRALKNIRNSNQADEVVEFRWNISDFDNLENISLALREGEYKRNFFLLLGGTISNFEFHDLVYHIRESMNPGDLFLLCTPIEAEGEKGQENAPLSDAQKKFFDHILLNLGFEPDEFEAARRVRNHRAETYYTIKKRHKVEFKGREIEFYENDQIVTGFSYYYTKNIFLDYIKIYFPDFWYKMDPEEKRILVFCKK